MQHGYLVALQLNDDNTPIEPGIAHPLDHGHRIHVGAWTTITVSRASLDT